MRAEAAPPSLESDGLVTKALDLVDEAHFVVSLAGDIVYANRHAVGLVARGAAVGAGAPFACLWREAPGEVAAVLARVAGSSSWCPFALTSAGGERVPLKGRGMVVEASGTVRTHYVLVRQDADRSQPFAEQRRLIRRLNEELAKGQAAERELKRLLETQQRLNRELVHRVKNNLALLASLLRQTRRRAGDGAANGPLGDFERRLISVAAVHDVLDRNAETDYVDVDQMIGRICEQLEALAPAGVSLDCSLVPLRIHVDRATALALIVNELLTNAMKHAFPASRAGTITVRLTRAGEEVEALIGDDGIGLEPRTGEGSGSRIVSELARQLEATITREKGAGTLWRIAFRPIEPPGSVDH